MKEKITQPLINKATRQAERGKAPSLYSWFKTNSTKQAFNDFKKLKPQTNQEVFNILMDNSTDKQIINQNIIYLKHNRKHILVFVNSQEDNYVAIDLTAMMNQKSSKKSK